MKQICELSLSQLTEQLKIGALTSLDATHAYLAQIERENPKIGAFLTVTAEQALQQATASDTRRAQGNILSPLDGVPMAVKDNICTKGIPTTCASKMLERFVPPYQATVAGLLEKSGAVLLGKLNMDEFAMGSSSENSAFYPVKNPVDTSRVPGGSSGGSAAAVAANFAAFTLGSDTGGSIRQPAAFCGVVGLKPTYGRVSRYGLVAFASSLDQIGPLTRTVEDAAMVLTAISGHDPLDSTSALQETPDFCSTLHRGISGMRIALPAEFMDQGIAPAIRQAVEQAAAHCQKLGATVDTIEMPSLKNALPAYYVISSAEASSNLARFDGVRYGSRAQNFDSMEELYQNTRSEFFGPEVKRRIMLGTFALSAGYYDAYYKKALQVRTVLMQDFERLFQKYDLLLSPTTPATAWTLGQKSNPMELYLGDVCTVPANIAGLPALSLPWGTDEASMPIGLQLTGKAFDEAALLQAAYALEQSFGGVL